MVETFVEEYAKKIALDPTSISVARKELDDGLFQIVIFASSRDTGRLIGRDGRMIGALKTLISGCKAKDGSSYKISVEAID
ncbi:MAG: KH domain-containing protein [Wolinella sp.]